MDHNRLIKIANHFDKIGAYSLADNFENLFKRKVDLMTDKPISNRFLKERIEESKQMIYAA